MTKGWLVWLGLVLLSFLVLEFYGMYNYGRPGTLTAHVQSWSQMHPLIPFGFGVAVGALAWHFYSVGTHQ